MESKFTQAFNGAKIGANEESMLLLFLSKVIFTDDKTYATTELVIFYFFFLFEIRYNGLLVIRIVL